MGMYTEETKRRLIPCDWVFNAQICRCANVTICCISSILLSAGKGESFYHAGLFKNDKAVFKEKISNPVVCRLTRSQDLKSEPNNAQLKIINQLSNSSKSGKQPF